MKFKNLILLMTLLTMFVLPTISFSQDVVIIPWDYEGNPIGAINRFIMGDTTAIGERVHPDAIYQLERGKIYFQNQEMINLMLAHLKIKLQVLELILKQCLVFSFDLH